MNCARVREVVTCFVRKRSPSAKQDSFQSCCISHAIVFVFQLHIVCPQKPSLPTSGDMFIALKSSTYHQEVVLYREQLEDLPL